MSDLTVQAIRQRLLTKITDMGWNSRSVLKPADALGIANDERELGFALPPLLKRIYVEIGNGGFGPGYGLIGLSNGVPDDLGRTAPEIYKQLHKKDPDESGWEWPAGLLPICHWGCAILSCVDCSAADYRMRIFDPNTHEEGSWTDSFFDDQGADRFEIWIDKWASGTDLWEPMYGENGHVTKILSARPRN